MKRREAILMVVVLFVGIGLSSLSFAQGMMRDQPAMGKGMMKSDMMGKCPMQGVMMKGMMEKTILMTADGGVIVSAGNKLVKYDKDLNVIKEVEIKIDIEAMQQTMRTMMKECPMMKSTMMEGEMIGNTSEQKAPATIGTEEKTE